MVAQYSILKISFNELLHDELSVGVFVDTGNEVWFEYSQEQLNKAKKLLPDSFEGLESYLKTVRSSVKYRSVKDHSPISKELKRDKSGLLNYLSTYHNNIIRITQPASVKFEKFGQEDYTKFFNEIFQPGRLKDRPKSTNYQERIDRDLIEPLYGKVHTNFNVNKNIIEDIYWSTELDCAGKNGAVYVAKLFNFDQNYATIDKHCSHYRLLIDYFLKKFNKPCRAFVLASEPEVDSAKHNIWEFMKKDKLLELRHPDEAASVANIILEADAEKFLVESN